MFYVYENDFPGFSLALDFTTYILLSNCRNFHVSLAGGNLLM
jgi:hypothetical protein